MNEIKNDQLEQLSKAIMNRNTADAEIARLIGRPAERGHIGEFIAAHIFDIRLHESAVAKGSDGFFRTGILEGKSVNVKFYGKQESVLAIKQDGLPDFILVLCGGKSTGMTSIGKTRPLSIESVFLFCAPTLLESLKLRNIKIDESATSVAKKYWEDAMIFPRNNLSKFELTDEQIAKLELFVWDDLNRAAEAKID